MQQDAACIRQVIQSGAVGADALTSGKPEARVFLFAPSPERRFTAEGKNIPLAGAQITMEYLLEQDATTIFGYPDGAVLSICGALYEYRDKINHIETSYKQGAAHATGGYARANSKADVCLTTSGPDATNLVTGIATAYIDSASMAVITGNVSLGLLNLDSFQEVDITRITMPITKHNFIVKGVSDLVFTLRKAFRIVQSGRRGPVLVDTPKDVTAHKCEFTSQKPDHPVNASALSDEDRLQQTVELLRECRRPFVYVGDGVIALEASDILREFSERLDAPVSCSLMCQGGFDQTDERYLGMLGTHGTIPLALVLKERDVLAVVDTRFSDRVTHNVDLSARGYHVVYIDIGSAEFNKDIYTDPRLRGDARATLQTLNSRLEIASRPEWTVQIKTQQREYPLSQKAVCESGVTLQCLLETLHYLVGDRLIPSTETGQYQMWIAQFYPFKVPRRMVASSGLDTTGFGLGAALDAQVAWSGLRVVSVVGDDDFHMSCAEPSTAAKYDIHVVELIVNNNVLGMVCQ